MVFVFVIKIFIFRSVLPEPLSKVLKPMSIHHLDMPDDDVDVHRAKDDTLRKSSLVRHGSVGTSEDPGVIGPVVWNMHCQRLHHGKYILSSNVSSNTSTTYYNILLFSSIPRGSV